MNRMGMHWTLLCMSRLSYCRLRENGQDSDDDDNTQNIF
jgi:hypothetical protein